VGVIPVYLNELSPGLCGRFFRVGVSVGEFVVVAQQRLAGGDCGEVLWRRLAPAMAWTVLVVGLLVAGVTAMGMRRRG